MKTQYSYTVFFITFFAIINIVAQKTDTTIHIIRSWDYDIHTGIKRQVDFDTNVFVVANYSPLYHYSSSNTSIGMVGGAAISNIFNDRFGSPFVFGKTYAPYFYNSDNYRVYKTKAPFSLMDFYIGGDKGQSEVRTLDFVHTQNVDPFTNVGFKLRSIRSEGPNDDIQEVTINNLSLFGSRETKDHKIHVTLNRNMIKTDESGGIIDSLYENNNNIKILYPQGFSSELRNLNFTVQTEYTAINFGVGGKEKPLEIDTISRINVSIAETDTVQPDSGFFAIQDTSVPDTVNITNVTDSIEPIAHEAKTKLILGQTTTFDQFYRKFSGGTLENIPFYGPPLINHDQTNDSAYYRSLTNRLYFKLSSGNQFITGGIENEFLKYAHRVIPDTTFLTEENENGQVVLYHDGNIKKNDLKKHFNTALFGDMEINISDLLTLKFLGNYYLLGYQQNTFGLAGRVYLNLPKYNILLQSKLKTWKPDYFYNRYVSNYFMWDNSFENSRFWNNEILIRHNTKHTGVQLNYNLLNNWTYFNDSAYAEQHNGITNIMSAKIFGEFDFWKFKTKNELVFQVSSNNNVMPLPNFTAYHSLSFNQKLFNDALHFNIGYEVRFFSKYYTYAYMPATGVFHTQNEKEIGSYPYIDVFASMKVKRTLFFAKYEQVTGTDISHNFLGKEYYSALHYLNTGPILRIGITWIFVN